MIRLEKISKSYRTSTGRHTVFKDLDLEIPTGTGVAFLGRNGAGKTTLINLIAGAEKADGGRMITDATISWPVGLAGGFQPSLTARQNVKFVARLYHGKERIPEIVERVQAFAEISEYFDMPVKTFSSGMRARVNFGLSMAFDFDYYLIDEVTAVGDPQFQKKCETALSEKQAQKAGFLVASHQMGIVRRFCSMGIVLRGGRAEFFSDVEEAIKVYQSNG